MAQGIIIASDPGGGGLGTTDGHGWHGRFVRDGADPGWSSGTSVPSDLGASSADWAPGGLAHSLCVMSFKFIHVVLCGRVFSFKAEDYFIVCFYLNQLNTI